jgi:hypothetical protein
MQRIGRMDSRLRIFELLGVRPAGLAISKIEVEWWGKRVIFDLVYAVYEGDNEITKPFQLVFEDCTNVSWEYSEDQEDNWGDYNEILGLHLKTQNDHEALILAIGPHVQFIVKYGSYTIKKDW